MRTGTSPWLRTLLPGVLSVVALLGAAGCKAAPKTNLPIPWTDPAQFDASYRCDYRVYHVVPTKEGTTRTLAGHVYHQANGENELYWVLDPFRSTRGFLRHNYFAFQLVKKEDGGFEHVEIGDHGLEGGVQRVLNLRHGTVELEQVKAVGTRKPEKPSRKDR